MQAAVRYAVAMQEHAGLDVITDGEWWRRSYIGVIAELAHGFELGTFAGWPAVHPGRGQARAQRRPASSRAK